jgi:LPXTG-motif cell wall-anchored protein
MKTTKTFKISMILLALALMFSFSLAAPSTSNYWNCSPTNISSGGNYFSGNVFCNGSNVYDATGFNVTILPNSTINNATLNNITVNKSTITDSTLSNMSVINSNVTNTTAGNGSKLIKDSTVKDANIVNSNIIESTIINKTVENSTIVQDSVISDSDVKGSEVANSTTTKSTITNSTVEDSNITNSTVDSGSTINSSSVYENSTVTGSSNVTNSTIKGKSTINSSSTVEGNSTIDESTLQNGSLSNKSTITQSTLTNSSATVCNLDNIILTNMICFNSSTPINLSVVEFINGSIIDGVVLNGTSYIVSNNYNNTLDRDVNITYFVNKGPSADYSPTAGYTGETITFTSSSTDPNINTGNNDGWLLGDYFNHTWGSTNTGTTSTYSISYSSAGSYNLRLNVTDSFGLWNTITKTITISDRPSGGGGGGGGGSSLPDEWECPDWSECSDLGKQERTCVHMHDPFKTKKEIQSCEPEEEPKTTTPSPRCGNGNLEANEECDDGNTLSLDGCSSICTIEPEEEGPEPEPQEDEITGAVVGAESFNWWPIIALLALLLLLLLLFFLWKRRKDKKGQVKVGSSKPKKKASKKSKK